MPRFLSTVLVIALLGGTAAAFAVTQGLKNEPSPITAPRIAKVFSPTCDCDTRVATIQFRLRKPDRIRLQIVDGSGDVVRTLVPGRRLRQGTVTYTWNGRDDDGEFVAEGVYKPRVHLADQHRTIDLPNEMQVDTTAPKISIVSLAPRTISPNGDGRNDRVRIAYKTNEPAHAILYVDGKKVATSYRKKPVGTIQWYGRGKRPGDYRIALAARDLAGNTAPSTREFTVRLRYIDLFKHTFKPHGRALRIRVSTDAKSVHWRLAGRSGTARPPKLTLPIPAQKGRYTLTVTANGHRARATVVVR